MKILMVRVAQRSVDASSAMKIRTHKIEGVWPLDKKTVGKCRIQVELRLFSWHGDVERYCCDSYCDSSVIFVEGRIKAHLEFEII